MKPFKREGTPHDAKKDDRGTVCITVSLRDRGRPVRGNRTRSISVSNARVSEVFEFLERSLFSDDSTQGRT